MSAWRVIFIDSESETGVAPVCDRPDVHAMMHGDGPGSPDVYDCCPNPCIETYSEPGAVRLAALLDRARRRAVPVKRDRALAWAAIFAAVNSSVVWILSGPGPGTFFGFVWSTAGAYLFLTRK